MTLSRPGWIHLVRSSASGGRDSLSPACLALRRSLAAGGKPAFPPGLVVQVKALACELPHRLGLPLSRLCVEEIRQHVIAQGLVAEISGATLWRWLSSDALRPWQHRSWIFPRDPNFAAKDGPILDLYHRVWDGAPLGSDDFVISADEKTSIQARRPKQPTLPPAPNRPTRVEHEYFRGGAWVYLAAWDVHRAKLFGRCELENGIAPQDRFVSEVMSQERALERLDDIRRNAPCKEWIAHECRSIRIDEHGSFARQHGTTEFRERRWRVLARTSTRWRGPPPRRCR